MNIDFYYWEDCPSHGEALIRLRQVLEEENVTDAIAIHEVATDEDALALQFPGSPTIRVNGADIDPVGDRDDYSLACRVYRTSTGRITPLPPVDLIRDAILAGKARAV